MNILRKCSIDFNKFGGQFLKVQFLGQTSEAKISQNSMFFALKKIDFWLLSYGYPDFRQKSLHVEIQENFQIAF